MLGAGTMGHGIAHAAITAGYDTALYDISDAAVAKGKSAIDAVISKSVELGKATEADAASMRARLRITTSIADAVRDADVVIEAARQHNTVTFDRALTARPHAAENAIRSLRNLISALL